jgi:hypothetical protein
MDSKLTAVGVVGRAALFAGLAVGLAGCYIVPVNPDGTPAASGPYVIAPLPYDPALAAASRPAPAPAPAPVPSVYHARLYPMNDRAAQIGQLVATITDLHSGRGLLSLNMAGETLTGEATRVNDADPGFGAVYQQVLNAPVRAQAGARRGIANATGNRGTWIRCEYVLAQAARGTGACLLSDGAAYQLHFGN